MCAKCDRRRATLVVLWFVVGVVALQAGFHYPLSVLLPQVRDVEYGRKLVHLRAAADRPKDRPLVVALGSSMTAMGFCPAALPGHDGSPTPGRPVCFNMGLNSCGVVVQVLCLRRMLADGIRPDLVVIESGPFFVHRQHNRVHLNREFLDPKRLERHDLTVVGRYDEDPGHLRAAWRHDVHVPWWKYRRNLQLWLHPTGVPGAVHALNTWKYTDQWGWEYYPPAFLPKQPYYQNPALREQIYQHHAYVNRMPPDRRMEDAFVELVGLCRQENLPCVMVCIPECSMVRKGYTLTDPRPIGGLLSRIAAAYPGTPVVDARDWVPDEGFVDGAHMTADGAIQYTRRLNREVLEPIFLRPAVH